MLVQKKIAYLGPSGTFTEEALRNWLNVFIRKVALKM